MSEFRYVIASPQFGNTKDVCGSLDADKLLTSGGIKTTADAYTNPNWGNFRQNLPPNQRIKRLGATSDLEKLKWKDSRSVPFPVVQKFLRVSGVMADRRIILLS